ncbi:hypothetical protein [Halalkalibacter alkaliphilus]|uniref:Uncharacterized protein n=1 Tax=Halalkalibacter alkaliphilus TaxID=2917993 RepID=A0A9X2CWE7_9BACI|nr:hypothetical protein [Halalkalibacter alkaliphilus]MCL7749565.1 hypothetical protein [Halalkalibacter alkaliphilus]
MATTQSLLWIALPNGMTMDGNNRNLRLSVFVNPRLRSNDSNERVTLASFPDFLNWAYRMQPDRATFSIEVADGTQNKVVPAYRVSPPPIQTLWSSLFKSDIPVHTYEFDDYSNRPIVSYPVKNVLDHLKNFYLDLVKEARNDLPCMIPPRDDSNGECVSIYRLIYELVELQDLFYDKVNTEEGLSFMLNKSLEKAKVEARRRRASGTTGDAIIPPFPFTQEPPSPPELPGPPEPPELPGPPGPGVPYPGYPRDNDVQDAYYRTMLFHYRPAWTQPTPLPDGPEAKAHFEEEIDFHQMLSALGDFPEILRRLGLIIDLYIPADSIPKTNNDPGKFKLRIVPSWSSQFPTRQNDDLTSWPEDSYSSWPEDHSWTEDYCPWTAYHYREENGLDLFTAHSSTNEIDGGIWIPKKEDVELVQVDVDGAALKTLNLAASIAAQNRKEVTDKPIDTNEESGVSPMRNGGISVVRNKNAQHLNDIFNGSAKLNQMFISGPPEPENPLYAEDLLRGYRLDVIDQNENRYSLHRRFGQYKILNASGSFEIIDEGFIQPSVTSSPESNDPVKELYIHESLFTWDGWSLSAPRPGKSISASPSAPNPDEPDTMPQQVKNTAMTRLGLETAFMVEHGTLPRLRFGKDYTFRVRTVDLAGNGPNLEEAKKIEAALLLNQSPIGYLKYLRFDPVNPPELVPRQLYSPSGNLNNPDTTAYAEGESLERLVIRSNYNKSTEEYAAANPVYQPFNDRHVAPPKASLQMIEEHGLLDAALDAKKSGMHPDQIRRVIQDVYYLATREAGSFNDVSLPSVRFIRTGSDPSSTDGYAVHTEGQLILPYLPDPWSSGVVFRGLPGLDPGELFHIDLKANPWYEVKPFRIRIVEGSFGPLWDEKTRVLTIYLPKASIVTGIRVSSTFGGNLEAMGLLQWVKEDKTNWTDQELLELEKDILNGRTWLFTPFREITLVHAVQQPLDFPKQPTLQIRAREENSTEAYLFGNIYVHIPSTSKVDILAEWTERVDDITKIEPELEPVPFRDHVMELPIWLDHGKEVFVKDNPSALHLEEYESRLVFDSYEAETVYRNLLQGFVTPENQEQMNLASKVVKHGFGDTKYRRVRYKVRATTRFREYFLPSMPNEDLVRETQEIEIDVLSSARPSNPLVKYVLPTFSWQQMNEDDGKVTSVRRGGVRLYLDRPWWSSGNGEMLGIVLVENKVPNRDEALYSYLTFWGQDPIRDSPILPLPTIEDFKNYKEVYDVHLFELPNQPVKVVCYEVHWDSERKMWYCDLDLDTGNAYYPFIRLALVRFQPNSLIKPADLRISPVVLADIVQTAPDRSLTVTRDPHHPGVYNVSVSGVTYSKKIINLQDNTAAPATSLMNVQVQSQLAEIEDETLGWEDVPNLDEIVIHPGSPDGNGVVIWEGEVVIPEENQGYPLRLVVEEIDIFHGEHHTQTYKRTVYMDIIYL